MVQSSERGGEVGSRTLTLQNSDIFLWACALGEDWAAWERSHPVLTLVAGVHGRSLVFAEIFVRLNIKSIDINYGNQYETLKIRV